MSKFFLLGFMGSGKSHWGRIWGKKYNLTFYDLDEEVEKAEGQTISDIFNTNGEGYFRQVESNTLQSFDNRDNFILSCGGGTPCFNDNLEWINKNGVSIYLKASPEELVNRLSGEKEKRPLIQNLSNSQLFNYIHDKLSEREHYYLKANFIVEDDKVETFELMNK